jgi:signal transduction histidine kinase/CheY-like chemotaxis protein/class 3 adenylate cyclase
MKTFANLSLKYKLIFIVMLTNLIALLAAAGFFLVNEIKSLRDARVRELSVLAKVVGANTQAALTYLDEKSAFETLSALHAEPHITAAVIYDAMGQVFAKYQHVKRSFTPPPVQKAKYVFQSSHLDVFEQIVFNQQKIGTVYIQSDLKEIHELIIGYLRVLVIVLIISSLLALLLSVKLQALISIPILHLATITEKVTRLNDYSLRAQANGGDEVGLLVNGFNEMLAQIQNRDHQLARHRQHLEEQVEKRTVELSQINSELEKTVTDLREAMQAVKVANQAKTEFLANISHEIRTPMNAVLNMSSWLSQTSLTSEQYDYVTTLKGSGETLLALIDDILDFSKIDAGQLELESEPFNLRTCVESALDLVATQATKKGLEIAYFIDEKTTPLELLGDVTRLRQILINLLGNAVKFTESGEVIILVSGQFIDSQRVKLQFSVQDSGIGIPQEQQDQLFNLFSQGDASMTRRYGGTGLGLAISKQLCELMGGRLWVESQVGQGSTFYFTVITQIFSDQSEILLKNQETYLTGKRVLIVDENLNIRRILELQMQTWGMQVFGVTSTYDALVQIKSAIEQKNGWQLILLNTLLSKPEEIELVKEINQLSPFQPLPVVKTLPNNHLVVKTDNKWFAGQLTKPIKNSSLFNCLNQLFASFEPEPVTTLMKASNQQLLAQQHPLRILLVEDNVTNQKVAKLLLERLGYSINIVSNGAEAVEAVKIYTYDVILMDIQMPIMDGMEATTRIRQWFAQAPRRPYIVAATAHAMRGYREKCLAVGMDDYITKPVRKEDLVAALTRCSCDPAFQAEISGKAVQSEDSKIGAIDSMAKIDLVPAAPTQESLSESNVSLNTSSQLMAPKMPKIKALQDKICAALQELVGAYEPKIITELIQSYLEGGTTLTTELQTAIVQQDARKLEQAAHSLKSSSASLGATVLADLCKQLEQQGRANDMTDAEDKVRQALCEYTLVSEQLTIIQQHLSEKTKDSEETLEEISEKNQKTTFSSTHSVETKSPATKISQSEKKEESGHTEASSGDVSVNTFSPVAKIKNNIQKTLVALMGEDEPAILMELIQAYLNDSDTLVQQMRDAVTQNDPEKSAQAAHSLKSSSGNLGAFQLAEYCKTVEYQGKNGQLVDQALLAQLEQEYAWVLEAIQDLQQSLENNQPVFQASTDESTVNSETQEKSKTQEKQNKQNKTEQDKRKQFQQDLVASISTTPIPDQHVQEKENVLILLVQEIKNTLTQLIGEEDPILFNELIQTYQSDAKTLIQSLRMAVVNGNADALVQAAHPLKSSSGNLGAHQLAKLAQLLEQKGKSNDLGGTSHLLAELELEYSQLCLALEKIWEFSNEKDEKEGEIVSNELTEHDIDPQIEPVTFESTPEPVTTTIESTMSVSETHSSLSVQFPIHQVEPSEFQILVVDDQPYDALLVSTFLREAGYQVLTANSGEQALAQVIHQSPAIVLSDVMMPGMNGFEVCQQIKAREESVLTPVVLITSLESQQDRIRGLQAGADEFLSKPVNREELMARVRSLLRYQQARKQLEQAHKEQLRNMFKRYISPKWVDEILEHPEKAEITLVDQENRQDAVILFADLRGFTAISEQLEPKKVVKLLNEFFTLLTEVAYSHEGTIFNMAGDCLLIGFGVPFSIPDAAPRAVTAAVEMQQAFSQIEQQWQQEYAIEVGLGIGINKGEIIVGNVGSPTYMNYTVIGDTVNVASRLVGLAKAGEIIISKTVFQAIAEYQAIVAKIEHLPPVNLKGKSQAQQIYKI